MGTEADRVAQARRWFRAKGYPLHTADGVAAVVTPAYPETWDANWITAAPDAAPGAVLAAVDRHFGAHAHQVVWADCLTDPGVEAALALAGFSVANTTIEMLATGPVTSPHPLPALSLRPVDAANWAELAGLVRRDHVEGRRTHHTDAAVGAGLLDGMRRKLGACRFWLIDAGTDAAVYGMSAVCPNGLGLIESLFTVPAQRGRGLMSAFIVDAARRLRDAGCDGVFLDAHAEDTPKHLYARLGFAAVALNRTWVRARAR